MNGSVTVESVLYRYFVRYDRLSELIYWGFKGSSDNTINIYIDLYGIYHTLFSRSYKTIISDYVSFTSLVINMCAHYRSFFKSIGVYAKIFLISSYNIPSDSLLLVPEYNKIMINKLQNTIVRDMVDLNTGLLELLCPYLPDIFFIKTNFESAVVMNRIMDLENQDTESLIISTDIYPIQLVAHRSKVSLLVPIKTYKGDESLLCPNNTHSEAKFSFWGGVIRKYLNSASFDKVGDISPSNLMLLASLNRFPDRCFNVMYNITKATRIISKIIGFDSIKLIPQSILEILDAKEFKNINMDLLLNRYRALDITYQKLLYDQSVESKTLHYENLEDNNSINLINSKYFANNPIDVFKL